MPKFLNLRNITILVFIVLIVPSIYFGYLWYKESNDVIPIDREIEGDKYLKDLKYSEAVQQYKIFIEQNKSSNSVYLKLADIYWKKNLTSEAIALLEKCLNDCTNNYNVLSRLINYNIQLKNFASVTKYLDEFEKQAVQSNKNLKESIALLRLHALNSLNNSEEALKTTKNYVDNNASTDEHLNFYLSASSYEDVEVAKRYLTNYPEYASNKYFTSLKEIYDKMELDSEDTYKNTAISNIARLLSISSFNQDFYIQLESESIKITYFNYYPTAQKILTQIISEVPDYYATYQLRGIIFFLSYNEFNKDDTNLQSAEKDFLKVLQFEPNDRIANLYLARIYSIKSNPSESGKFYTSLLSITQNDTSVLKEYAQMLIKYEFYIQAAEKYKELTRLSGQNKSNFINTIEYTNLLIYDLNKYSEIESILNSPVNQWDPKATYTREERPDLYFQIDFNLWYSAYQLKLASVKGKVDSSNKPLENLAFYNDQLTKLKSLDTIYTNNVKIIYHLALLQIETGKRQDVKEASDALIQTAVINLNRVIDLDLANEYTAEAKEKIESLNK